MYKNTLKAKQTGHAVVDACQERRNLNQDNLDKGSHTEVSLHSSQILFKVCSQERLMQRKHQTLTVALGLLYANPIIKRQHVGKWRYPDKEFAFHTEGEQQMKN